ncbi:MAG: hypothetical protein IKJ68_10610 [Clostridia bacterium]|nr:hypothetical protein [Clostridia bacterium]
MNKIKVDFNNIVGRVKPLHAVNCAPYSPSFGEKQEVVQKFFTEGSIPYCRLHDCCGSYGGARFIDVSNIFRDFDADETNPENYDFHYSDEYIAAIEKSGCKTYYRLGETIEWGSKKYTTLPPKDFAKWARICEHIIMHYNEGWANGFNYDIEYWEIWNEPENPGNAYGSSMWGGTKEEFFELYKIVSKHLKNRFPNIKMGGYGSCGFYTQTRDIATLPQGFETFVPYFTDFLKMVKENECPLDFYTWHIYTGDETELEAHAKYVRETLDEYGFKNTEAHLNEWNIHSEGHGFAAKHTEEGASFNGAVLAMLSYTNYVDMANYYCFSFMGAYNGFLNQNDKSTDKPWYPFVAYGNLWKMGSLVKAECTGEHIYAVAATGDNKKGVLISNYMCTDKETEIILSGIGENRNIILKCVSDQKDFEEFFAFTASDNTTLKLNVPERTVIYIEL